MTEGDGGAVLYTTMNDLSSYGGVETMIAQEVRYLQSRGLEIHLICPAPEGPLRIKETERVHLWPLPKAIFRLPGPLRGFLAALLICQRARSLARKVTLPALSFSVTDGAGCALAKLTGADIRAVLRICGPLSYEVRHFKQVLRARYRLSAFVSRLFEAFAYYVADAILPISEFEETNVRSYGVRGTKVRVIRCGIDATRFTGSREVAPLKLPASSKIVMFVGRLVEKNGPLVVAEAAPAVLRAVPGSVFVFVGDGPLRPELELRLASEIAAGRVVLTGFREDVPELLGQADVYAGHLSSKVQGLGQTVFEALMSGLPVVAGRDWISERIVAHGVHALLVPKDDPQALSKGLEMLLEDEETRKSLGTAARNLALEKLSFDAMMREVLRHLLGGGREATYVSRAA